MRRTPRSTESLTHHRLLPRAERELFQDEIVRFHLEDLNALAERQGRRRALAGTARERARAIVQAARWDASGFLRATRRFIDEGRAAGADAFGPALLLLALGAEREPFLSAVAAPLLALARSALTDPRRRRVPSPPSAARARQL